MSAQSTGVSCENTGAIYTGLIFTDNQEYSTLKPSAIPEAQKTAESRQCRAPYKMATMCLGLLCALLVTAVIILCVYSPLVVVPTQCPLGHVPFRSRCYYFSRDKNTWEDSRRHCKGQGANLVVIQTKEEQEFIYSHYTHSDYWIGLRESTAGGTWLWVDGSPPSVGYWREGEPNNYMQLNESCVHGSRFHDVWKNWNDKNCDTAFNWVCEANP